MFERFSDEGRRAVVVAQEEARLLNHNYIGTEHVLLALLRSPGTVAARALEALDISLDVARAQVLEIVGTGGTAPSGHIPFTPRAKKVLELSLREALELGHNSIGSEHILLGLVREGEGVAAQILIKLGADLQRVRALVVALIGSGSEEPSTNVVAAASSAIATALRTGARLWPSSSVETPGASAASVGRCAFCGRDLWDVDRYVRGEVVAICDDCIEASHHAVNEAGAGARELDLPPRVSGADAGPDAAGAVVTAFRMVFSDTTDARAEFLDDGEQIVAYMNRPDTRVPAVTVHAVRVSRIRFSSADRAEVRFSIVLQPGSTGFMFEGEAVRRAGRWIVSRDTYAQRVAVIGIQLPPPE